jgi:hypothetical protein
MWEIRMRAKEESSTTSILANGHLLKILCHQGLALYLGNLTAKHTTELPLTLQEAKTMFSSLYFGSKALPTL